MSTNSSLLSTLATIALIHGCGQNDRSPVDRGDAGAESDGFAGAPTSAGNVGAGNVGAGNVGGGATIAGNVGGGATVAGAGGIGGERETAGASGVGGGFPTCESFQCIDGRISLFNSCPGIYTACDVAQNDGVQCVERGPCPKDAADEGTCEPADTDTDPNHCGACGKVCAPSILARDTDLSNGLLTSDAANVYWASTTSSWVKQLSASGGDPVVIYGGDSARATAMAAQGGNVYLAVMDDTFTRGSVRRIPADGSNSDGSNSTTLVADPSAPILELAVDESNLYWYDNEGTVFKASLSNGLPQVIAVEQDANGLAVDANDFYWSTYGLREGDRASIKKVPLDGGEEAVIAELSDRYVEHLAIHANDLYWVAEDGAISRMPKAGGAITVLAKPSNTLYELTIDETHAYWTTRADEPVYGTVHKVPLAGGPVTTLARLQHEPTEIALTDSTVVWIQSYFDDRITSIDKDPCRSGRCVE
jgi:hypothetical protein